MGDQSGLQAFQRNKAGRWFGGGNVESWEHAETGQVAYEVILWDSLSRKPDLKISTRTRTFCTLPQHSGGCSPHGDVQNILLEDVSRTRCRDGTLHRQDIRNLHKEPASLFLDGVPWKIASISIRNRHPKDSTLKWYPIESWTHLSRFPLSAESAPRTLDWLDHPFLPPGTSLHGLDGKTWIKHLVVNLLGQSTPLDDSPQAVGETKPVHHLRFLWGVPPVVNGTRDIFEATEVKGASATADDGRETEVCEARTSPYTTRRLCIYSSQSAAYKFTHRHILPADYAVVVGQYIDNAMMKKKHLHTVVTAGNKVQRVVPIENRTVGRRDTIGSGAEIVVPSQCGDELPGQLSYRL
ncbi:hypothetical protein BDM02DRAFT_3133251 [Thelephora ganbajun]|uniref:Uncharacterized protein n=1 Tax=Thelephora ganbajun TaxID=370292 RepID=A0ACB6YY32_THEGA|nr:hypothetical protein BDM02DRAFT_3133251 [Thelephora ganbajun]